MPGVPYVVESKTYSPFPTLEKVWTAKLLSSSVIKFHLVSVSNEYSVYEPDSNSIWNSIGSDDCSSYSAPPPWVPFDVSENLKGCPETELSLKSKR